MFPTNMDDREKIVGELFEKYKNLVFKTAFLMYGNKDEAEEALQEVFLLVYRYLPGYDPAKGAMTTWLHRITINYCLRNRQNMDVSLESLDDSNINIREESVDSVVQAAFDRQSLCDAIQKLSGKLKAVIILRYYWELSYNEISEILSIPLGTVKSRIDQALKTLAVAFHSSSSASAKDASPVWERVI